MAEPIEKKREEVVINLDSFAIPIAIVVAGIIIALGIFLSNKNNAKVDGTKDTTNTETTDPTTDGTFAAATTTIDDDPYLGNKETAKVAVVEFSDYQCPYCQRHAQETLPSILKDYVNTGKVIYVFRDFPLDFHGQIALTSAWAGECVHELVGNDKFAVFHEKAYMAADEKVLTTLAKEVGANEGAFSKCVADKKYEAEVAKDLADGQKAGVTGTPGFVVGVLDKDGGVTGKLIEGAYPYASFQTLIDEMFAK